MPEMDGFDLAKQIKQTPGLAGPTIMMLSSAGQYGDKSRLQELGIALHLVKPIRQSDLLDSVIKVLSKPHVAEDPPAEADHDPAGQGMRRISVLLAEDNPVNQRVAAHILEKRGHEVTVAGDGKKALAAMEDRRFDLVLMDVQMPETDGFQATAAIREKEKTTGGHVPIIAMTAHAMKGDRERCLAAGMDGYVSKPIGAIDLIRTVENPAVAQHNTRPAHQRIRSPILQRPWLDWTATSRLCRELAELFLEGCPRLMTDVREAIDRGDSQRLERAAHALKGAVANFGVGSAFQASLKVETMAQDGNLSNIAQAHESLECEIERFCSLLSSLDTMGEAA